MSLPATSVNPGAGPSLQPEVAALAHLAFASSTPAATRVAAGGAAAAFAPASADALDLDLSDPDQCHFGDYTLRAKLGQGGMGVVYHAHQHSLDRDVAVKLLAAGPWASPGFIERFRLEAQSAARMQHPNIVTIHEIGEQDGLPFFSMRLVRGHSLAEQLLKTGPLPPRRAAMLLRTVAEAVDYAHRLGVLHLDIKPGNVLIDEHGEPMVADFGLARRMEGSFAGVVDEVSGTPSYMAPEQATAGGRIGVGTDVYALGATLYEALTGRPPFRGATARETLEQVVYAVAPAPRLFARAIPLDLQAICMRCLRKDPVERYPSAAALAEDLAEFLKGREVKARPLGRTQRLGQLIRREPRLSALVMLFVASLFAGLLATTAQWNRADANATDARESLWRERAQAAETALAEGDGFHGLQALVTNLGEMESAGHRQGAAMERQRIGALLANAPMLVDRIPLETGQVVTSVALAPDATRFAVATFLQDGRRSVRQYELASGKLLWETVTNGLTHNLSVAEGAPHGALRYSADGTRVIAAMIAMPVFAAPVTPDQIALDSSDGRLLQPSTLPPGFSDIVYDDDARRAIVRWRTQASLRFPDRLRMYQVDGWQPVGEEQSDTSTMWLFAPDGQLLRTLDFQHFEFVEFGTLAPRWSVSVSDDQLVRAWRFAPDGGTLALGALDGSVLLVNTADGAVSSLPSAPVAAIRWLEFDREGRTLAAIAESGQLAAWDLPSRRPRMAPLRVPDVVQQARVRVTGDFLALAHGNAISVWQLPPLAPFDNDAVPLPGRVLGRRPFNTSAFDFDPARRLLVSGGADGAIGVWRLPPSSLRAERAAPLAPQTQFFDGRRLVAVDGASVRVLDLHNGVDLIPPLLHPHAVDFAELSADGRWLSTIAGRTLRVFDATSGRAHGVPMALSNTPLRVEQARSTSLLLLVFGQHEDGRFVERVHAIDLDSLQWRAQGLPLPWMSYKLHLDPHGRYLLAASEVEARVEMLDLGGAPSCSRLAPEGVNAFGDFAISADGASVWMHISPGRRRAEVLKLNLADCRLQRVAEGPHLGMTTVLLATEDGVLAHRHLANALAIFGPAGELARVPTLPASRTLSLLARSDDGRRVAVATRGAVQVYDIENGERLSALLVTPLPGNDGIQRLAFSPDGTQVLARSIFGHWMLWSLPSTLLDTAALKRLALALDPPSATHQLDDAEHAALRAELRAAAALQAPSDGAAQVDPVVLPVLAEAAVDPRFLPLDLRPALNVSKGRPWLRMAAQGGDLATLAAGTHRLGGIDWRIDGALQLSGGGPAVSLHPRMPESAWVELAPVAARRVHVLMLLHVPMRPNATPRRAGLVRLRHVDGSVSALDILSVRDVVTHWQPDLAAASAHVAWRGISPTSVRDGETYWHSSHVYAVSLDLPANSAPLSALRLEIGDGPMEAPLFYAVTLEVDPPAEGVP